MPRLLAFALLSLLLGGCSARDGDCGQREAPVPISLPQLY